jgi:hypothetical protein
MKKPVVAVSRPIQWGTKFQGKKFDLHPLTLFGIEPRLKNGKVALDSVGAVIVNDGMERALEFFRQNKPAAFLFSSMYYPDGSENQIRTVARFIEQLKTISPSTKFIYWNGNQQGYLDYNAAAFLPCLDAVLTNTRDPADFKIFEDAGVKCVATLYQFGFDPEEHGQNRKRRPKYDCFFAGSQTYSKKNPQKYPNSKWRYDFILAVANSFRTLIHGKGTWAGVESHTYLYGQEFYDTFLKASVVIGANHWDLERYYTRRTVYALASGRPYVVREIPGMQYDFENKKHLCWFKDIPDGLDMIKWLLKHPVEAGKIGEAGRKIAVERFSWEALLGQFEDLLENTIL